MADSNVKMVFSGSAEDALKAIAQLERKLAGLENRVKHAGKSSGDGKMMQMLGGWSASLVGIAAGYMNISGAIEHAVRSNVELMQQADEVAKKWDETFRKIKVQAPDLTGAQQQNVHRLGAKYALSNPQDAATIAQALSGSGMAIGDASGGGLESMLRVMRGTGAEGDPRELTLAMTKYLKSQQLDVTPANIERVGKNFAGVFGENMLELQDFADLAKEGASLKDISMEDQFAAFTALTNVKSGQEAATDLRNTSMRLKTAGASKRKTDALADIGLTPESVDMVGESYLDAMGRVAGGLHNIAPEKRAGVMARLFEEAGVGGAQTIMDNLGSMEKFRQQQKGGASVLERGLDTMTGGRAAGGKRLAAAQEQILANQADPNFDKLSAAGLVMQQYGVSKWFSDFKIGTARVRQAMFGTDTDTLVSSMMPLEIQGSGASATNRVFAESQKAGGDVVTLLEEIRDELKGVKTNTHKKVDPKAQNERGR